MYQAVRQTISCPKCGRTLELSLWPEIDTDTENAREDIISGRLFDVRCECGFATQVQYPMSFEDKPNRVKIWYCPEADADSAAEEIRKAAERGLICRLVHDPDAFSEKACIFRAGLDDRLVEVMKLAAKADLTEALSGAEVDPIVFSEAEGQFRFLFRYMGQTEFVKMDMGEYEQFQTIFAPMLELVGNEETVVDRKWAMQFLGMGAESPESDGNL